MDEARIEACARMLLDAAIDHGMPVTGDRRVNEADAAVLLGLHPGSLKNLRAEGSGPVAYRAPTGGCRWSYRLTDLAAWIEGRREAW